MLPTGVLLPSPSGDSCGHLNLDFIDKRSSFVTILETNYVGVIVQMTNNDDRELAQDFARLEAGGGKRVHDAKAFPRVQL